MYSHQLLETCIALAHPNANRMLHDDGLHVIEDINSLKFKHFPILAIIMEEKYLIVTEVSYTICQAYNYSINM